MGNGSRVTTACLSPPFRSSQTAYCYTDGLFYAERDIPVSRNIFTCADYPNPAVIADLHSQTVCATLLCRACLDEPICVAVMYLTLRTGCSRGRTPKVVRPQQRKNPLPFPYFAAVTCRQSAPDSPRERGDSQEGGNRRCLPSCAPARRQRSSVRFASENPPPGQGEPPVRFVSPGNSVQKKEPALQRAPKREDKFDFNLLRYPAESPS